jgi:hypothetical protein
MSINKNLFIASPDLLPFYENGALFDAKDSELEKNIGKRVKYINPSCGIEHETFTIVHLQKDCFGRVIYRGFCEGDQVGRPICPELVEFID